MYFFISFIYSVSCSFIEKILGVMHRAVQTQGLRRDTEEEEEKIVPTTMSLCLLDERVSLILI